MTMHMIHQQSTTSCTTGQEHCSIKEQCDTVECRYSRCTIRPNGTNELSLNDPDITTDAQCYCTPSQTFIPSSKESIGHKMSSRCTTIPVTKLPVPCRTCRTPCADRCWTIPHTAQAHHRMSAVCYVVGPL